MTYKQPRKRQSKDFAYPSTISNPNIIPIVPANLPE